MKILFNVICLIFDDAVLCKSATREEALGIGIQAVDKTLIKLHRMFNVSWRYGGTMPPAVKLPFWPRSPASLLQFGA
jgi:hypothetical protein